MQFDPRDFYRPQSHGYPEFSREFILYNPISMSRYIQIL